MHKYGFNSTLYNIEMKGFSLFSCIFIWTCPVCFCCDKIPICDFNLFICFHQWVQYKILNIRCRVTSCTWVWNPIGSLRDVSKFSSGSFRIEIHIFHITVYLLRLDFICTVSQHLIYFCLSIRTVFSPFCVPVNFIIQSVWFRKNIYEMIPRSTSEAHIWFTTVAFITLIIRVAWIEGWFLIPFFLSILIK